MDEGAEGRTDGRTRTPKEHGRKKEEGGRRKVPTSNLPRDDRCSTSGFLIIAHMAAAVAVGVRSRGCRTIDRNVKDERDLFSITEKRLSSLTCFQGAVLRDMTFVSLLQESFYCSLICLYIIVDDRLRTK